jgi:hypothetical protein
MKNITIGLAGPTWKPAKAAIYYAERGDGEDYAFGETPIEALTKLETREASSRQNGSQEIDEEVAFLALGAADFLKDHKKAELYSLNGYTGFISEVIRHAPLLASRWRKMDGAFGGVWLYDITERFGREWAEIIFSGETGNPETLLNSIIEDEMEKWR